MSNRLHNKWFGKKSRSSSLTRTHIDKYELNYLPQLFQNGNIYELNLLEASNIKQNNGVYNCKKSLVKKRKIGNNFQQDYFEKLYGPVSVLQSERKKFRQLIADTIMGDCKKKNDFNMLESIMDLENGLIISEENSHESLNKCENMLIRYYNYIHNGINADYVSPMSHNLEHDITNLINPYLLNSYEKLTNDLLNYVKDEFLFTQKKIAVDEALFDGENLHRPKNEIKITDANFKNLWSDEYFLKSKKEVNDQLLIVHPVTIEILKLCSTIVPYVYATFKQSMLVSYLYELFSTIKLLEVEEFLNYANPAIELSVFLSMCSRCFDHAIDVDIKKWHQDIYNIISNAKQKGVLNFDSDKLQIFYRSIDRLIKNQTHEIAIQGMNDYVKIFAVNDQKIQKSQHYGRFLINVVIRDQEITLDPSYESFNESIIKLIDDIIDTMNELPLIKDIMCLNEHPNSKQVSRKINSYQINRYDKQKKLNDEQHIPNINIDKKLINECKEKISSSLFQQYENCLAEIEKFVDLNRKINQIINTASEYLKSEVSASFEQLEEQFNIVKSLYNEIFYGISRFDYFENIFCFHYDYIKRSFLKRIETINMKILNKMYDIHISNNHMILNELQDFSSLAFKTPTNTFELIELSEKVEKKMNQIIKIDMPKMIEKYFERILCLLEKNVFTQEDFVENSKLFSWYTKVPSIYADHQAIIAEKRTVFIKNIQVKKEKLNAGFEAMDKFLKEVRRYSEVTDIQAYHNKTQNLSKKLQNAMEKIDELNREEEVYGKEQTRFTECEKLKKELDPFLKLFEIGAAFETKSKDWLWGPMSKVIPDRVEVDVTQYDRQLYKVDKNFNNKEPAKRIAIALRKNIEDFKHYLPLVNTLFNPGLRERHWQEINKIVGFEIQSDRETNLQMLIDMDLLQYTPQFSIISDAASKEMKIEQTIEKIKSEWSTTKFTLNSYRDTGSFVFSAIEEILTKLDDDLNKLLIIKSSAYAEPFLQNIEEMEKNLKTFQDVFEKLMKIQSDWMYLQPIFSSPDIAKQMPDSSRLFRNLDNTWRDILSKLNDNPVCMTLLQIENIGMKVKWLIGLLEDILRALNNYLEQKRLYFPRFFFLSNDELIEILSETKDPTRVQPYFFKCFEGVYRVTFNESLEITHIISRQNEIVELIKPINTVKARGQVEKWLFELEIAMKDTTKSIIMKSVVAYNQCESRLKWIKTWINQAVLFVTQFYWTKNIESAFLTKSKLLDYLRVYNEQIREIVDFIRSTNQGESNDLNNLRLTIGALIVLEVHARDVLQELVDQNINHISHFTWLSQLRNYIDDDDLVCKMVTTNRVYGYEYLGNTTRLVITPLTDRCYRTLLMALNVNLGGAPEGPAGTGKTETTKDLAKALAKYCIVFNCSEGLDYIALQKFFKGLASCGAWSCFDEFNRINLEVLSVVAQQILTIQRGINAQANKILFEGTEINLNPTCAIFITMNPGYAGRSELPDNLKALFRPVAMMIPDYCLISEISLYSCGFQNARNLAVKIVSLYKLCSEQLSRQDHYDYGMRAVKSVLNVAATLKMKYSYENETLLILRALIDVNQPKFKIFDVPLFMGIISELFPGVDLPTNESKELSEAIKQCCNKMNLQCTNYFLEKIHQIYQMILVRHGLMLVGNTLSGKTSCYNILADALNDLNEKNLINEKKVIKCLIYPKSMSASQLYGSYDLASHEWTDGILAKSYRNFTLDSMTKMRKWLIFDGPVDAIWIENLNSVLDDNKKLCLMSGETINLPEDTNLIFETMDLEQASPATVSRCGMIYMETASLGWRPLVKSWLIHLPRLIDDKQKLILSDLFEHFVDPCVQFVKVKKLKTFIPSLSQSHYVMSMIRLNNHLHNVLLDPNEQQDLKDLPVQIENIFFFSLLWSIGANLTDTARNQFSDYLQGFIKNKAYLSENDKLRLKMVDYPTLEPLTINNIPLIENTFSTYFDYKLKFGQRLMNYKINSSEDIDDIDNDKSEESANENSYSNKYWEKWNDSLQFILSRFSIAKESSFDDIIVPTIGKLRHLYFLNLFLHSTSNPISTLHNNSFQKSSSLLFVGPTGTGKSCYTIDYLIKQGIKNSLSPITINFSAQTTFDHLQSNIIGSLFKQKKGIYGPPEGFKSVIFIDDVNMPKVEKYGAQPPIELLRQLIDQTYFYEFKDYTKLKIDNFTLICAMSPPDSGRNKLNERFLRHFNVIGIDEIDENTLSSVYKTILKWNFDKWKVSSTIDFSEITEKIVKLTIDVYKWATKNFLPTPRTPHYMFNLRDFSRVIKGICFFNVDTCQDLIEVKQLWLHEISRVFIDRLNSNNDRNLLINKISILLHDVFNENIENLLPIVDDNSTPLDKKEYITHLNNLIFMETTLETVNNGDLKVYRQIDDLNLLKQTLEISLDEYNELHKDQLNLVLFNYAILHVCRICRILKMPHGHGLLIGFEGSGRQSLTRLAVYITDCDLFQVSMSRKYDLTQWHEDLKLMLKKMISSEQHVAFLISDNQIKDEAFLEDVSNLLNSGTVPGLFTPEEKQQICDQMAPIDRRRDKTKRTNGTPQALFNYFIDHCKSLLHIVLTMSPFSNEFKVRLRKFPSLINCCNIDWFDDWPENALESVAKHYLNKIENFNAEFYDACIRICIHFHLTTSKLADRMLNEMNRYYYVTPCSYLELLKLYKKLFDMKRSELFTYHNRYLAGVEKLESTAKDIVEMKEQLINVLQPHLTIASEKVAKMVANIEKETAEMTKVETNVKQEEEIAEQQAIIAQEIKNKCDRELGKVMPQYNAAIAALNEIKPLDIAVLKSMKNPPENVKLVMEAVCILLDRKPDKVGDSSGMGKKDDYWGLAKKVLTDPRFIETIKQFDKDNIPVNIIKKIRDKYLSNPEFKPEKVRHASSAAEGLCKWVIALDPYDSVVKVVAPQRERLKLAEYDLKIAKKSLQEKSEKLKLVKLKVIELQASMQTSKEEKLRLEQATITCKAKLDRAEALINGLGDEKTRWKAEVENLSKANDSLLSDILFAAGYIAYMGPFTNTYRQELLRNWMIYTGDLLNSNVFSLQKVLGNSIEIMQWNVLGLPSDTHSIENAIIMRNSNQWPLIIDPQGQANKWLKKYEAGANLNVTRLENSNYYKTLESSITLGQPCLIENVGEILDPLLESILLRRIFTQSGNLFMMLGDQVIEYSSSFRLYLTTKLSNPHYSPNIAVKMNLINFMITNEGLEDQLLGIAVARERPELEEERNYLIIQSAKNKKELKEIESKILETISTTSGNILDDETAVNIVSNSQILANSINEKQRISDETEKQLNLTRLFYKPIAIHATILFFSCLSLSKVEYVYQYSLQWFIEMFIESLENAKKSDKLEERLEYVKNYFMFSIFSSVCRSIFEKDKLLFSFIIWINFLKNENKIDENELKFLLTGGISVENELIKPVEWLPVKCWDEICRLSTLPKFSSINKKFVENESIWKELYDSETPVIVKLPSCVENDLNDFQRLLILRCFRPDKTVNAINSLIKKHLGDQYIQYPSLDLDASFKYSSPVKALVFLLTPGGDPTQILIKFSIDKGFNESKVKFLSMGQGQGQYAQKMIEEGLQEGNWIVLQNCHLAISWMPNLEKIYENLNMDRIHPNFRLWLTTYPTPDFPISLLQDSIKITNERPQGLKNILQRSYIMDPINRRDFFERVKLNKEWKKLLFSLVFFHAVVQERRKYVPIGFNIPYEFNETDLIISIEQLHWFLDNYEQVPYDAIKYLTAECNYGGRITDNIDRRTIHSLLSKFYSPSVISNQNYKFDENGLYCMPIDGSYDDYLKYINELPVYLPNPNVLGMHQNATITRDLAEIYALFDSFLNVQDKKKTKSSNGQLDNSLITLVNEIISKLPSNFDEDLVSRQYPSTYRECLNTVLVQEIIRFNGLLNTIRVYLSDISKALNGLIIMSDDLEDVCDSILKGKLPNQWRAKSYASRKPLGSYINDLVFRLDFFKKWIQNGAPKVFSLPVFFFTQSFLTALQQNYARRSSTPIDLLTHDNKIMSNEVPLEEAENGAFISGLYLSGARWNAEKNHLDEQISKILFDVMPIIWIYPARKEDVYYTNCYKAPVYITSERRGVLSTTGHSTNFLIEIKIPSNTTQDHWIMRGCACLLQLDD